MSIFGDTQGLEEEDPILSLGVLFRKAGNPQKVNLGVGAYMTAKGQPFVLASVSAAERHLVEQNLDKEYLPIEGDAVFLEATLRLVFGADHPLVQTQSFAAAQTVGATAALRLGGDYLALEGPRQIFVSDPTWSNHRTIFGRAGLAVHPYPYFDKTGRTLDFSNMCASISQMRAGSAILLHACCHNPTGIEPTQEQWQELSRLIQAQGLFPFFDLAYQGFGVSLAEDSFPVRHFAEQGHNLFVAYSFSKNFGLYGERVGALIALCENPVITSKVQKQLKSLIRGVYSTPPLHGGRIVAMVLGEKRGQDLWENELTSMRQRVQDMRKRLVEHLSAKTSLDISFLLAQRGLFSYGLLRPEHVSRLRDEYAIYLPGNGRINVAGLNPGNLDYVVNAIHSVML